MSHAIERSPRAGPSVATFAPMERIGSLLPTGPRDLCAHRGARRQSTRFPLNARVDVFERGANAHGVVLNASEGGLRVAIDRELREGSVIELEVRFTEERQSRERARVVWSRPQPDGWLVGLRFVA